MSRTSRAVRVVGLSLTLVGLAATAAWAVTSTDNLVPTQNYDHWCANAAVCQTDNATVSYYMDSGGTDALESGDRTTVQNVISGDYQPTDLSVSYDSTPVWDGSGETDWYIQEETVSGDADGRTTCNDPETFDYGCDQHYVTIEPGSFTWGLTCHELGHAVGLVHGDLASPSVSKTDAVLGCMKTPVSSSQRLGSNQVTRINNNY